MGTQATDHSQYLITCEHREGRKACTMQFFYLPEHEAAGVPRMCGEHRAAHMRFERNMQGHPHWSVD